MRKKQQYTRFGLWVCNKMKEKNMWQNELAEMLGVKGTYINKITRGTYKQSKYIDLIIDILADDEKEKQEAQKLLDVA